MESYNRHKLTMLPLINQWKMQSSVDDFYMLLPSNASPSTQPRNTASDYIVDLGNPLNLDPDDKWKVALTELSYIYHPHSISSSYGIHYQWYQKDILVNRKLQLQIRNDKRIFLRGWKPNDHHFVEIILEEINGENHVSFRSNQPFELKLPKDFSRYSGIAETVQSSSELNHHSIRGTKDLLKGLWPNVDEREPSKYQFLIEVNTFYYSIQSKYYMFPKDKNFKLETELVNYIQANCVPSIFHSIAYNSKRVQFTFSSKTYYLKFFGGFNFTLGFDQQEFWSSKRAELQSPLLDRDPFVFKAPFDVQLNRGVQNMYIYASICAPLRVGHTWVPLLKNIFVDTSKDADRKGHARSLSIHNPMYVDVGASYVDHIEVNIRNDAGNIIGFPKGGITLMTLHFKKTTTTQA